MRKPLRINSQLKKLAVLTDLRRLCPRTHFAILYFSIFVLLQSFGFFCACAQELILRFSISVFLCYCSLLGF